MGEQGQTSQQNMSTVGDHWWIWRQTLTPNLLGIFLKPNHFEWLNCSLCIVLVLLLQFRPVVSHSRSSSLSLTIENALESFDFLNTSDFEDEGGTDEFCGDAHGADSVFLDTEIEKNR